MSAVRLFILGMLDRGGPMHGHQIRRSAQVDRTELWTDFKAGSVYAALQRMERDGTIAISYSGKVGNRPERTVFEITEAGRNELQAIRDAILASTELQPDPVDLAFQNAHTLSVDQLRDVFEARLAAITAQLIGWQQRREAASPYISARESLTFDHTSLRLDAEAAWCRAVLAQLAGEAKTAPRQPTTRKRS